MFNEEVWAELASVRREIKSLKATVERLEAADLRSYLWRNVGTHELGRCDSCHEPHELAVVRNGLKSNNDALTGLCLSCYIRRQERQVAA